MKSLSVSISDGLSVCLSFSLSVSLYLSLLIRPSVLPPGPRRQRQHLRVGVGRRRQLRRLQLRRLRLQHVDHLHQLGHQRRPHGAVRRELLLHAGLHLQQRPQAEPRGGRCECACLPAAAESTDEANGAKCAQLLLSKQDSLVGWLNFRTSRSNLCTAGSSDLGSFFFFWFNGLNRIWWEEAGEAVVGNCHLVSAV